MASNAEPSSQRQCVDLLMLGHQGVGKSAFVSRWGDDPPGEFQKIPLDFRIRLLKWDDQIVKVRFWDLQRWGARNQPLFEIAKASIPWQKGFLLSYDVSDRETLEDIGEWLDELDRSPVKDACKILVGCKSDSEKREISYEEGQACAALLGVPFIETSAKDGRNVDEAVELLLGTVFAADQPVVLTVLAVLPRGHSGEDDHVVEVTLATIGGETFTLEVVDSGNATAAGLAACVSRVRQLPRVTLLSESGGVLLPHGRLPGLPEGLVGMVSGQSRTWSIVHWIHCTMQSILCTLLG
eukprot:TRINITY_DN21023_c0_g1_i1.p1 TRINITY_DN21023_c0_g1~~TRINITY_DN21023_c0_g1_i1.p1  ORF type:complete len:323 (-),score=29.77 TRINITY_DN21023_c0_g1_i1:210-1097(-)